MRLDRKWNPFSCNEAIVWAGLHTLSRWNLFYKNRSALSDWNHVLGNENEQRRQQAKRKRKIHERERILLDKKRKLHSATLFKSHSVSNVIDRLRIHNTSCSSSAYRNRANCKHQRFKIRNAVDLSLRIKSRKLNCAINLNCVKW